MAQHPTINDALPNKILAGTVIVKSDIEHFTENGVVFKGMHFIFILFKEKMHWLLWKTNVQRTP